MRWRIARRTVARLRAPPQTVAAARPRSEPHYDPHGALRRHAGDLRKPYDVREVIARLVDGS